MTYNLHIIHRVASRYIQAGSVVPFAPKSRVPTVTLAGTKYFLSTDGGPTLGDREDDELEDRKSPWGGRLIRVPTGNKWKYLWVYDTEKRTLTMWLVSEGNEKLYGPANAYQHYIFKLDKKGQLNRVSNAEYRKIDALMQRQADQVQEAMIREIEEGKSDEIKEVDELVQEFFDKFVSSKVQVALRGVANGASPLGFKPFGDPEDLLRQKSSFVFSQIVRKEMTVSEVSKYLQSKGVDVEEAGQWINFAIDDVIEKEQDKLLPPRSTHLSFKYEPKETKQHKAERVGDSLRETTGLQKGMSFAIAEAFVRGRDIGSLAVQKDWPIERGVITGPKGDMPVSELSYLL
jgi:hypothetical protein